MIDSDNTQDSAAMSPASAGLLAWRSLGMISDERLKSLMEQVGMPNSRSLKGALMQCDKEARLDAASRMSLTDNERWALEYARNCCRIVATPLGTGDALRAAEATDAITELLDRHRARNK